MHVSSAGVTRPDRPGLDLTKQPPAVRMNKELGFILTYKLKVLTILLCNFLLDIYNTISLIQLTEATYVLLQKYYHNQS